MAHICRTLTFGMIFLPNLQIDLIPVLPTVIILSCKRGKSSGSGSSPCSRVGFSGHESLVSPSGTFPWIFWRVQAGCRRASQVELVCGSARWETGYAFGARKQQKGCHCLGLLCPGRGTCPVTGDVHFDDLIVGVTAWFLHLKVTVFLIREYILRLCKSASDPTHRFSHVDSTITVAMTVACVLIPFTPRFSSLRSMASCILIYYMDYNALLLLM